MTIIKLPLGKSTTIALAVFLSFGCGKTPEGGSERPQQGPSAANSNPTMPAAKRKPAAALPAALVAAWTQAGAKAGWMDGELHFREDAQGREGEVPAFSLEMLGDGIISKLPQPMSAFGLYMPAANGTAALLRELAALKRLQRLYLFEAKVTDAALKELAASASLQGLQPGTVAGRRR